LTWQQAEAILIGYMGNNPDPKKAADTIMDVWFTRPIAAVPILPWVVGGVVLLAAGLIIMRK